MIAWRMSEISNRVCYMFVPLIESLLEVGFNRFEVTGSRMTRSTAVSRQPCLRKGHIYMRVRRDGKERA